MSGGSAGSAYAAEISALQTYQKQILSTLDNLVASEAVMTIMSGLGGFTGSGSNSGLGTFPEAVTLSSTYTTVMQNLMTNFKEISALITTMANVLGKSAQNYMETEQQLTDSFNKIVSQYESQTGSFSTPGGPTATAPTGTSAQTGTSSSFNSATPATATPATTSTTPTSSGSIEQENDSNESNNTSSEE